MARQVGCPSPVAERQGRVAFTVLLWSQQLGVTSLRSMARLWPMHLWADKNFRFIKKKSGKAMARPDLLLMKSNRIEKDKNKKNIQRRFGLGFGIRK